MCPLIFKRFVLGQSRVVGPGTGERNFHIFYQMTKGASAHDREQLGMMEPKYFHYLNVSGEYHADGINDVEEYEDMKKAMAVCQISEQDAPSVFQIVAGILHLGNITFIEEGNDAKIADPQALAFPAYLFVRTTALPHPYCRVRLISLVGDLRRIVGVETYEVYSPYATSWRLPMGVLILVSPLFSRIMTTGGFGKRGSSYTVPLNVQQAQGTRDALAKVWLAGYCVDCTWSV